VECLLPSRSLTLLPCEHPSCAPLIAHVQPCAHPNCAGTIATLNHSGTSNLRLGHFIRVGQFFYGPEQAPSSHTLSGQAAMDVGEVIRIEIEPRGDPQRVKRHRQEVQRVRRALPTL
jgi:hypothetical protein